VECYNKYIMKNILKILSVSLFVFISVSYFTPSVVSADAWTEQQGAGQRNWQSITSSSDGTKLAAVVDNGYIYTSIDSGNTWVQKTSDVTRSWRSITSSSDGTKLTAVVSGGYIYTYPLPTPSVVPPLITTLTPTSITKNSATLNGNITSDGFGTISVSGFRYGTDTSYDTTTINGPITTGIYELNINHLDCNTTYHYLAYVTNEEGVTEGQDQSFKTNKCPTTSGSSASAIVTFQQEQQERAEAIGLPTTPVITIPNITPSTSPTTLTRTLKYGMQGDDVKKLQVYLNTHNYLVSVSGAGSLGNETNYFGLKTKQAVIKFQLANGLVGDGIVGSKTKEKMK